MTVRQEQPLNWQGIVAPYTQPELRHSVWQLVNTLGPYLGLWAAMLWSVHISYWITLALAIPAAGFLVRTFILFHDACHGSFFKSAKANRVLGILLGFLTLTPFYQWRHDHAIHHATAGNLDKRDVGDVPVMTVQEYLAAPWWKRIAYRIVRHPLVMFTFGASLVFVVFHRFWPAHADKRQRWSVIYTNLALLVIAGGMSWVFGPKTYFLTLLPIILFGCSAGVWMFYVQHQFEGVYWETKDRWSFVKAGLEGSSFYKLPAVLEWFSGNIGYHHIHHLSPKIPNYHLPRCYRENSIFHVKPLTILSSLRCIRFHLIDDATRQLVGWSVLKQYRRASAQG